jgi:hypothetical protein
MDAGLAAIIGAAVGALGAIGAGLAGVLAPLGLEKRQLDKERRTELMAEIAAYTALLFDWALRYNTRTSKENAEIIAGSFDHQAAIALRLKPGESDVSDFMTKTLNAAVRYDDARSPVAIATFALLPKWYRGEVSLADVRQKTKQVEDLAELLKTGAPAAGAATTVTDS